MSDSKTSFKPKVQSPCSSSVAQHNSALLYSPLLLSSTKLAWVDMLCYPSSVFPCFSQKHIPSQHTYIVCVLIIFCVSPIGTQIPHSKDSYLFCTAFQVVHKAQKRESSGWNEEAGQVGLGGPTDDRRASVFLSCEAQSLRGWEPSQATSSPPELSSWFIR